VQKLKNKDLDEKEVGCFARAADEKLKDNDKYDEEYRKVFEEVFPNQAAAVTMDEKNEIQFRIDS
jgi:hypothetical protein